MRMSDWSSDVCSSDRARLRDAGRVILAADSLGAGQAMIEKAVDYAGQREQFGRLIGSFQAVKHMCAEMAARHEPCRSLVWYAAHAFDAVPNEAPLEIGRGSGRERECSTCGTRWWRYPYKKKK